MVFVETMKGLLLIAVVMFVAVFALRTLAKINSRDVSWLEQIFHIFD
jgi:hypothetical protein